MDKSAPELISTETGTTPSAVPGARPAVLWTLRLLALAGLAISLFLTGVHIIAALKAERVRGPYCRILSFFDCETVLNSEWGTWFGVPVPVLGAVPYVVLLVLLFARRSWWWPICALTATIAGAAVWFIYLQAAVLDRSFCMWCMMEHVIGLTLFVLTWLLAFGARALSRLRGAGTVAAAASLVAVLIVGQHLDSHTYVKTVRRVTLDAGEHLLLGSPSAAHTIVEGIDYTCPRCKRLSDMVPRVRELLGPSYAIVILTTPLHPACNKYYAQEYEGKVEAQHQYACELAELAHAVRLASPKDFESFHQWLFDHQAELKMNPEQARTRAMEIVGEPELAAALAQVHESGLIARDVELAVQLGIGQLPGLIAADQSFSALPEDADTLAGLILQAFSAGAAR